MIQPGIDPTTMEVSAEQEAAMWSRVATWQGLMQLTHNELGEGVETNATLLFDFVGALYTVDELKVPGEATPPHPYDLSPDERLVLEAMRQRYPAEQDIILESYGIHPTS